MEKLIIKAKRPNCSDKQWLAIKNEIKSVANNFEYLGYDKNLEIISIKENSFTIEMDYSIKA